MFHCMTLVEKYWLSTQILLTTLTSVAASSHTIVHEYQEGFQSNSLSVVNLSFVKTQVIHLHSTMELYTQYSVANLARM